MVPILLPSHLTQGILCCLKNKRKKKKKKKKRGEV